MADAHVRVLAACTTYVACVFIVHLVLASGWHFWAYVFVSNSIKFTHGHARNICKPAAMPLLAASWRLPSIRDPPRGPRSQNLVH
jgi:hypothetical protein